EEISGIQVMQQHFKAIAYADDLTIGIGSSTDWETLLSLLQKYEMATNSKINRKKSILVPITDTAQSTSLLNQNLFKVADNKTPLRIFGYEIKDKSKLLPRFSTYQLDYNRGRLDAPVLKDILDSRLVSVWVKLLTTDNTWPRLRELKGWPDNWKPYLVAWKRLKGSIMATNEWPWNISQLEIHEQTGNNFTVKKAADYLKQSSSK
ncbi:4457_t:CDS:2, partial [Ambispora leptoticha]